MLRSWHFIGAVIVLTIGIPQWALALPQGETPFELSQARNPRPESESSGLFEALNVSPQQKQEMQEIQNQHRVTLQQQQQQLRQVQKELNQLIASDASEAKIRQKHNQLLQMTQDMKTLNFDVMMQLRGILTPDQRARFAEIMQDRRITPARNSRN